ncbi:Crp/Fnr family transcriptional regulator [Chloroflexota bacterium]
MTKLEVLKKCPFVRELDDEQLKIIAQIGTEEVYEVGESLCKQGRTVEKLFLIEDGLVGLYLELGPMTHRQLQAASNFEVIGWSALMPPYRGRTTVKAMETTKVLAFNGKKLIKACETYPLIGYKVYRGLASVIEIRLENAFTQLMGVTAQE